MTAPLLAALFAPAGQSAGGGLTMLFIQAAAIFAIFYFLIMRPQRRQQDQHRKLLASLQKGDQIATTGGVLGEVVHLKENEVTIRSGEAKLVVQRSAISAVLNRSAEPAP